MYCMSIFLMLTLYFAELNVNQIHLFSFRLCLSRYAIKKTDVYSPYFSRNGQMDRNMTKMTHPILCLIQYTAKRTIASYVFRISNNMMLQHWINIYTLKTAKTQTRRCRMTT